MKSTNAFRLHSAERTIRQCTFHHVIWSIQQTLLVGIELEFWSDQSEFHGWAHAKSARKMAVAKRLSCVHPCTLCFGEPQFQAIAVLLACYDNGICDGQITPINPCCPGACAFGHWSHGVEVSTVTIWRFPLFPPWKRDKIDKHTWNNDETMKHMVSLHLNIAVTFTLSRVVDVLVPSHFNATKPLIYRVTTCSVHAWASLADGFCKEAEAWAGRKHVSAGCALLSQNDRRPKNKSENTSLATILEFIEPTVGRPQVG